ncbi:fibulin-1-like isoform X2 [Ruditapes philippinarum]|uniref:fibulin-1-like isoform X2 n=1 Tax=Ruditapes philippinarum TaxID=129788 RepID=UPI00295A67EE|nr:fibulin-1-like isoform X2 [Ruditapes philippinarum]
MEIREKMLKCLVFGVGYLFFFVHGDFTEIVNVCCLAGTNWASNNDRCDTISGEIPEIDAKEQFLCQQVREVCCIKSKQDLMCTKGMENGLEEGGRCAVRDDLLGAVTYKECCSCCQMGLAVRRMGMSCTSPSIGNPCDMKFLQCCRGYDRDRSDRDDSDEDKEGNNINECELFGGEQLCSQICVDTPGSYKCQCHSGYRLASDERTCYRDDCSRGYAFNTVTGKCEDIDECVIGTHDCNKPNELCRNVRGSFTCQCEDGFYRNRTTINCEDIDECARRTDTCTASQRCENTAGSYSCRRITPCGTGWTLDEKSQECVDQDECTLGTHNCGTSYECYNIEGSFRCNPKRCPEGSRYNSATNRCERFTCARGMKPDMSGLCVDINECNAGVSPCRNFQSCQNTYGSYRCIDSVACGPGFQVDVDGQTCIDIDECREGTHDCGGDAQCINHRGSYICSCPQGYRRGRNGVCEDKNECQYGNVCPSNAKCENTPGSFRCLCDPGFEQSGSQRCRDINECEDRSICTQGCNNLIGSYVCTCETGYKLAADGRTCIDIDECRLYNGPGVCAGNCVNTPGSYMCSCPNGWRIMGNGRSCGDIDECQEGTDRCGSDQDVMCFNTRGSHRCPRVTCPSGFSRSDLGPRRNSDVQVESDSILCKKFCPRYDINCQHNETTSVSYQFFSLPSIAKVDQPAVLLNITAQGFILVPQMYLHIVSGNDGKLFDTVVEGETAMFRLVKPLIGPDDIRVMIRLENRSYIGNKLLSAHNAHLRIFVSRYKY